MSIYIIFKNSKITGFLQDEKTTREAVSKWADQLTEEMKQTPKVRIFRENTECGVRIYSQSLGDYLNGPVVLEHVIEYKPIIGFTIPKSEISESLP